MTRTKTFVALITLAALCALPAFGQRDRRPQQGVGESRRATINVAKAGDSLSFDGCTDGRRCRANPVDSSRPNLIHTVVWRVDMGPERVQTVDVTFKNNVTPCFSRRNNQFRDAASIRGNRESGQGFVVCRIKVNGWSENSDGNRIRALDRDEYPYSIKVVTNENTYEVDPIVIVRRGGGG